MLKTWLMFLLGEKYKDKIVTANDVNESLNEYRDLMVLFGYVSNYQSLHSSVDQRNEVNSNRSGNFYIKAAELSGKLTFFMSELKKH